MPQFDPTWFSSQIFWLAILFVTFYVLVSRLLLPPIIEIMERRKTTMEGDIATAQSMKLDAQRAKESYERALAEARAKSQSLIDSVMAEQKSKSDNASRDMETKVSAKLKEAEREISNKQKTLLDSLLPATSEMATMIAGKLLGAKS
jgi:F-type H+-transporting ATPase subunit b